MWIGDEINHMNNNLDTTNVNSCFVASHGASAARKSSKDPQANHLDTHHLHHHHQQYHQRDGFLVFVNAQWFALFWWMVAVLRGCEIAFLTAMVWLYLWLVYNPLQHVSTIDGLTFEFSYSVLAMLAWMFVVIIALQALMLFQSLYYSIKHRRLMFVDESPPSTRSTPSFYDLVAKSAWGRHARLVGPMLFICNKWRHLMVQWIEPVLYIHGKHFDQYYLFREYSEVVSQLYQAYQMSIYIPTRWINNVFVTMIFLNCISTPIVHAIVPGSNLPLRRLVSVSCSALLNYVNIVLIPFIIFIPYPSKYDTSGFFEDQYLMDDAWYARAVRENQQLFVTSYLEFVVTWFLHWSQFSCLLTFTDLIRHRSARIQPSNVGVTVHSPLSTTRAIRAPSKSLLGSHVQSRAHHGLWVIGLVVLGIHLAAQRPHPLDGCRLDSTPWFASGSSCVVMYVNCYRRDIEGNEQELDAILSIINTQSLFQLILGHCPRLQIPKSISKFHQLSGMDLFNVTIDKWSAEASLSDANHSKMIYFAAYRSNMTTIPEGLRSDYFPKRLAVVYLEATNLTTLPDNLHTFWPRVNSLYFDLSQFDQFPATLAHMPELSFLAFRHNRLRSLGEDGGTACFQNDQMTRLSLSNSTLSSLPNEFVGSLDHLIQLDLEHTQLSEIPKYICDWLLHKVANNEVVEHSLYGSPFCNVTFPEEDQELRVYQHQVCGVDNGTGAIPLIFGLIEAQRPL